MAFSNAYSAFLDTLSPAHAHTAAANNPLAKEYRTRWAFYANSVFEQEAWQDSAYRLAGLYRDSRPLYNPIHRSVELLVNCTYPGIVPLPGIPVADGVPIALPLAFGMDKALVAALPQLWQWSGAGVQLDVVTRNAAVLGDVLVETVDDMTRRKIYYRVIWPGDVAELVDDPQGNLKYYALEYQAKDENGNTYTYRKEVDATSIRTFRDGKPYGYDGNPPEIENWYGFVPARWFRWQHIGGVRGAPAWYGAYNKIPRMMALASHIHDYVHKLIEAPQVLWTDTPLTPIAGASKRSDTDDTLVLDRESVVLLQGSPGGRREGLIEEMNLGQALALLEHYVNEVEKDQPILRVYDQLRQMSQVTGPAAERLVGDAANGIYKTQAGQDAGWISLWQQGCAIAGERIKRNDWGTLTAQQRLFGPFDLSSYAAGQLNIGLDPRRLLPLTVLERIAADKERYSVIAAGVDAGLPLEVVLRREDWTAADIAEIKAIKEANRPDFTPAPAVAQEGIASE